jgi:hypothetical protein
MEQRNLDLEVDVTEEPRHIHVPRPSRILAQTLPVSVQLDLCEALLFADASGDDAQAA